MSKFNKTAEAGTGKDTVNAAGCPAYSRKLKNELASTILNSMLKGDSFYESEKDRIDRVVDLVSKNPNDAEFVAKAMIYARDKCNLRSISHLLGVLLSETAGGKDFLKSALNKAMLRPDDATEMIALYHSRNRKDGRKPMVPNALRKAIKESFESKWDEYQLKKYAGERNTVKLKDAVKLSRPNPKKLVASGKTKDEQVFKKLIESRLSAIKTAQTVNASATGESRATEYKNMLSGKKLGYMAALKNIKNILESEPDQETVDMLCELLRNEKAVKKSRLLPFRFLQAYERVLGLEVDQISLQQVINSIKEGFFLSSANIPVFKETDRVSIMLDASGSMTWNNTGGGGLNCLKIGASLMASLSSKANKDRCLNYLWACRCAKIDSIEDPFKFINEIPRMNIGGGTNMAAAFTDLIKTKTKVDKIVILSDMQHNSIANFDKCLAQYRQINKDVKIIFWNLEGYGGGSPIQYDGKYMELSGFSDKLIEVAGRMLDAPSEDFLVQEIEAVKL